MIPIKQTKLHNPPYQNGNCLRACYASILEIDIDSIPFFEDMEENDWWPSEVNWAKGLGFQPLYFEGEFHLDGYYLVCGKSPRGDFNHIVVYNNKKMIHDPHPDNTGIETIEGIYILLPHDPSKFINR